MESNKISLLSVLILILIAAGAASAVPLRVQTFTEAVVKAKESGLPVAVYVHGSSWHRASRSFKEIIWADKDLAKKLGHDVILTDIHIRQNLDKEQRKAVEAELQGWESKAVRSYPALQVYASDGFLLKTIQGHEIRSISEASALATKLDEVLASAKRRRELLAEIESLENKKSKEVEASLLVKLIKLPINRDPSIVEKLREADPADSSGWQALLMFKDWGFLRDVNKLIKDKKVDEALAATDKLLQSDRFDSGQRALILGARGMALAAKGDLPAAWASFCKARDADPEGANGRAIWRHGIRIAGIPLRVAIPPESALSGKNIGENISRDIATYTLSSSIDDDPARHDTLFSGAPSASGLAFHTKEEKNAHIKIDLQAVCEIRALRITNRRSRVDARIQRAKFLTLWVSQDGNSWTKAWAAEKVASAWDVFFENPMHARYLKLGLDRDSMGPLHLHTVDIYGVRP